MDEGVVGWLAGCWVHQAHIPSVICATQRLHYDGGVMPLCGFPPQVARSKVDNCLQVDPIKRTCIGIECRKCTACAWHIVCCCCCCDIRLPERRWSSGCGIVCMDVVVCMSLAWGCHTVCDYEVWMWCWVYLCIATHWAHLKRGACVALCNSVPLLL